MGSGNESEIFDVMLDKSTYLKVSLIQSTECIFHVRFTKCSVEFSFCGHNAKDLSRHGCRSPYLHILSGEGDNSLGDKETICDNAIKVDPDILSKNLHQFQQVGNASISVISAFLEDRNFTELKFVRILALVAMEFKNDVLCKFNTFKTNSSKDTGVVYGQIKMFPESVAPFCRWKTAFIYCPLPHREYKPQYVSLFADKCSDITNVLKVNSLHGNPTKQLGVCTHTMFNYTDRDIGHFIEFIELNLKFGVDKIFVYDTFNISANMEKVLQYYVSRGAVINVPWKVPVVSRQKEKIKSYYREVMTSKKLPNCVRNHAQHLAYLDCLYSNMAEFEYLAFLDRDEVIVPHKTKTLPQMLKQLSTWDPSVVSFTNYEHHFCTKTGDILDGKTTQKFTTTTLRKSEASTGTKKSIVKPKYILNMHVHVPILLAPGVTSKLIPSKVSTVHHYRSTHKCRKGAKTVQDTSLVKHWG